MAKTGLGRWHNVPKKGQRGFRPTQDHYDIHGTAPPRHLQCELHGCHDLALQDPGLPSELRCEAVRVSHPALPAHGGTVSLRHPLGRLLPAPGCRAPATRQGEGHADLRPRPDCRREPPRQMLREGLEMEEDGKQVVPRISRTASASGTASSRSGSSRITSPSASSGAGPLDATTGLPPARRQGMAPLRPPGADQGQESGACRDRAIQASLLRKMIAADLQVCTGRTDYALREAEANGDRVLPKRQALGWFQDRLA
jgi:hypothetical protein